MPDQTDDQKDDPIVRPDRNPSIAVVLMVQDKATRQLVPLSYDVTGGTGFLFTTTSSTFKDSEGIPANVAAAAAYGISSYAARRDHAHTIGAAVVTNAMLAGLIDLTTKVTGLLPAANMVNSGVHTGDCTTTFPLVTVGNLAITNAKIANTTIDLTAKVTGLLPAANLVGSGIFTGDAATTFPALTIANAAITAAKMVNAGVFTGDATTTFPALTIGAAAITASKMASAVRPGYNYLINGGFDVNQRGVTALGTTALTLDKYATDRWKVGTGVADCSFARTDTVTALESGLNARYYGKFTKASGAVGKLMIYQWLESVNTLPLAGRTVTFSVKIKASLTSNNKVIRIGIIQLTNAGTADTIGAGIMSAQGANSIDPTLTAASNFSYVTTAGAVPIGAGGGFTGNGVNCSTTTAWQLFAISVTAPTNAKNLAVAVWSDDTMTNPNDVISISEAQLIDGGSIKDYLPVLYPEELARCQRYCNSYGTDYSTAIIGVGYAFNGTDALVTVFLPVEMRTVPALPSLVIAKYSLTTSNGTVNALAGAITVNRSGRKVLELRCTTSSGLTAGNCTTLVKSSDTTDNFLLDADF